MRTLSAAASSPLRGKSVSTPTKEATGPGRRSKFSSEENPVLLREIAVCKTQLAPTGETRERFELAVCKEKATKKLPKRVRWKELQDRYKHRQAKFDEEDRAQRRMSGIGGEVCERDELLAAMKEGCDESTVARNSKREKENKKEQEKEG